jgi:hypothetical protein
MPRQGMPGGGPQSRRRFGSELAWWLEHAADRAGHYHYVIAPGLQPADVPAYFERMAPLRSIA